ncbi:hypothetical protein PG984_011034 [Apiospora sp. TS-2023a]
MVYCPIDPVEAAKNIQLYFDRDGRYATECFVGNGALGHVYKLKTTNEAETRRFIVKIPFEAREGVLVRSRRNFLTEEAGLKALQAAMHVVKLFGIPDDPLDNPIPQGAVSIVKGWVYMERLENGTLEQFITRAKGRSASLPNRLIWRLLMCSLEFSPLSCALTDKYLFPKVIESLLFDGRNPDIPLKYDPKLDLDLYRLIDPSMGAVNMDPMCLHYMEQAATEAIHERTAAWYGDSMPNSNLDETDEADLRMVREFILEPSKPDEPEADVVQALIEGFDFLTI